MVQEKKRKRDNVTKKKIEKGKVKTNKRKGKMENAVVFYMSVCWCFFASFSIHTPAFFKVFHSATSHNTKNLEDF